MPTNVSLEYDTDRPAETVGAIPKRFVARQPIFDKSQRVYGYELLFRCGLENVFSHHDGDMASDTVIDEFLLGMEALTEGRVAFINCTREVLVKGHAELLPKRRVVLEILEDVAPDEAVIEECKALKAAGYMIALDDFDGHREVGRLIELADIIKVDFRATTPKQQQLFVERFAPAGIHLIAEKVETREEFLHASKLGYSHIQGHFFAKPEIITTQDIPGFKLNYLRLLRAIHQPELDLKEIEPTIRCDLSLCFKLLRYLNSALFGFRAEIRSIRHALGLLGDEQFRKWASVVLTSGMAQDKAPELVVNSLIRARFCELLTGRIGLNGRATDLFLMGLLSLMDAILDQPMAFILESIPVATDIKAALLGKGGVLRDAYRLVLACEAGDWKSLLETAALLNLSEEAISESYLSSLEWSRLVFPA